MSKKKQRRKQKPGGVFQWQAMIEQARRKWLWQKVHVDARRGDGLRLGMVMEISDQGDVTVVCLPGHERGVPAVMMSLGYLDQALTLVDEEGGGL